MVIAGLAVATCLDHRSIAVYLHFSSHPRLVLHLGFGGREVSFSCFYLVTAGLSYFLSFLVLGCAVGSELIRVRSVFLLAALFVFAFFFIIFGFVGDVMFLASERVFLYSLSGLQLLCSNFARRTPPQCPLACRAFVNCLQVQQAWAWRSIHSTLSIT